MRHSHTFRVYGGGTGDRGEGGQGLGGQGVITPLGSMGGTGDRG